MEQKVRRAGVVKIILLVLTLILVIAVSYVFTAKMNVEALIGANAVLPHEPYEISATAQLLHDSLVIADWHTDSLMWLRDILDRSDIGQVDIPRLGEGNVAVQVFTAVTRVPDAGIQLEGNPGHGDQISSLAFMDKWPKAARESLLHRALFLSDKLFDTQARSNGQVKIILDRDDLGQVIEARRAGERVLGAVLGTEGLHPLEGSIDNVAKLYNHGYRVMGLFHFFDNELGGSLHGTSHAGLSEFGKEVVVELNARDIVVDLAHASEASVRDVLELSDKPVILSHTGMRGVCDSPRNIPDELMVKIAEEGGVIGIGYWEAAICDMAPAAVVDHIRYAIDLLGAEHVSLGSDYDGSVEMPFDVSEIAILTQLMLDRGFTEAEMRAVMGENIIRFLTEHLPASRVRGNPGRR